MLKIDIPNKAPGDERTAAEDNHVKEVVNHNADELAANSEAIDNIQETLENAFMNVDVVPTYSSLEAYNGTATLIMIKNKCYGGVWQRNDSITINPQRYGIERSGYGTSKWQRVFEVSEFNVNWWNETGLMDGSVDTSTHIQNAVNTAIALNYNKVNFSGKYLASNLDLSCPGVSGVVFEGNGCEIKMNHAANAEYLILIGAGGGSGGSTLQNFNFKGTSDSSPTYTDNKHKLIKINGAAYPSIFKCNFSNFTSSAIECNGSSSASVYRGVVIQMCHFEVQPYDSSTVNQTCIFMKAGSEYSIIAYNYFINVVSAIKGVDAANILINNNICESFVGPLQSLGQDLSRGVFHFSTTVGSPNNNKIIVSNNMLNHIAVGQVLMYFEATNTVNIDNTVQIFANQFLSNTKDPAIYLKDFNNPIIGPSNHIRCTQNTDTTSCIILDNTHNAKITGNNGSGRYMVNLINGSSGLRYDYNSNTFASTLGTNGHVQITSGSLWTNTQNIATATSLTINLELYENVNVTALATALLINNPTKATEVNILVIRIKDDGVTRALSFGSKFRAVGSAIPTATTAGKVKYIIAAYNYTEDKWDVISVRDEA